MTDQHSSSGPTQPADGVDNVVRACVHLDAAAKKLEVAADSDAFSPLLGLASQLALIRGGINPTIRAAVDPDDRLGPMAHLDRALCLLDSAPPAAGPADLLVWTLRLDDVRHALIAAWVGQL